MVQGIAERLPSIGGFRRRNGILSAQGSRSNQEEGREDQMRDSLCHSGQISEDVSVRTADVYQISAATVEGNSSFTKVFVRE